jgi:hypothetical protein
MRHARAWSILVALFAAVAGAAAAQNAPVEGMPPIAIAINGGMQHFATPPITMDNQVLVPMRDVFEALGATVVWHGDTKAVTAHNAEAISLRIGNPKALVGQRPVTLSVAPMLYGGRTYIPVHFVHDALGAQVAWDATGRTVTIASAPRQYAEARPQLVAPAQPQVPPAAPRLICPAVMRPHAQVLPRCQIGPPDPMQTQVVTVSLTEYRITLDPTEVHPGTVTLEVSNDGRKTHALAIEGSAVRTPDLDPGRATTLTFIAEAGRTYTLYCPMDQHRMLGMEARLPVR